MYRAQVNGQWLDWVSNADPEWMRSVQSKYNLGGSLDTSGSFAGVSTGATISGIEIRVFEENSLSGGSEGGSTSGEVTPSMSYMVGGTWKSFSGIATAPQMDGIKIQTSGNSSYYLQYRTWNQGQSGYYPYVRSNIDDYAGSSGKPIQRLQIQAYSNDGTKLVSGVVVMYRAQVNGQWLDWVSNADPEWMRSVQSKYNLGGSLDTSGSFAGVSTGATISGIEIRVFEENSSSGGSSDSFTGNEVVPSMSYMVGGTWTSFSRMATAPQMDGIKIQTSGNSSYYLQYRTWNQGQSGYYPYVRSNIDDYAGSSGKPIQRLQIQAYSNDGTKLVSGVVVMYRAQVNGQWLDWVSNADPEWMRSVQSKYNLGGSLDTSGSFAGVSTGATISGIEIRVFEENSSTNTPSGTHKIIQAPHIYQTIHYPTGCESVSTVMALNYAGINTTVDSFIDNYLDKSSGVPFDPNTTFGGNPRSSSGYGCYAPVIMNALNKLLPGKGYYAQQLSNVPLQDLCSQYIDKDIPVIIWATMNMAPPRSGNSWSYNGRKIQWIAPEHCLLLVGYDDNNYIFNDPQKTQALTYYSKASVDAAYKGLYSQAIVLQKGESSVPVTSVSVSPSSTTKKVGEAFGLTTTVTPSNATNKKITYSSNNPSVATVNDTGLVIAKSEGKAVITVKTADGGKEAKCNVTVRPLLVYQTRDTEVMWFEDNQSTEEVVRPDLFYNDMTRDEVKASVRSIREEAFGFDPNLIPTNIDTQLESFSSADYWRKDTLIPSANFMTDNSFALFLEEPMKNRNLLSGLLPWHEYTKEEHKGFFTNMATNFFANDTFDPIITDMIEHFAGDKTSNFTGTIDGYSIYKNSALSSQVQAHSESTKYVDNVKSALDSCLKQQSGNLVNLEYDPEKRFDNDERTKQPVASELKSRNINQPVFASTSDTLNGFTICLDSLQGNKIEILSYSQNGNSYSGIMRVTYYDHFGLNAEDFTSEGYGSIKNLGVNKLGGFHHWYIMQRYKDLEGSVHPKPFITTIEITTTFSGAIK